MKYDIQLVPVWGILIVLSQLHVPINYHRNYFHMGLLGRTIKAVGQMNFVSLFCFSLLIFSSSFLFISGSDQEQGYALSPLSLDLDGNIFLHVLFPAFLSSFLPSRPYSFFSSSLPSFPLLCSSFNSLCPLFLLPFALVPFPAPIFIWSYRWILCNNKYPWSFYSRRWIRCNFICSWAFLFALKFHSEAASYQLPSSPEGSRMMIPGNEDTLS